MNYSIYIEYTMDFEDSEIGPFEGVLNVEVEVSDYAAPGEQAFEAGAKAFRNAELRVRKEHDLPPGKGVFNFKKMRGVALP